MVIKLGVDNVTLVNNPTGIILRLDTGIVTLPNANLLTVPEGKIFVLPYTL